ncbi:NapC/NirT family cytochrome c, partial [Reinekea sp.]
PLDYVISKIRATKDVYHEFVTGKIDTEEKYEEHRAAMAETVWAKMRKNDSITCRSCHTLDAMDTYEQSAEAVKNHEFGVETGQTCIDCHKGVAHFPPLVELDSAAFDNLRALTTKTKPKAELVYPIESIAMGDLGSINPATKLTVAQVKDGVRTVEINAYQMKGAEQVLYAGLGQRSIVATLSEAGISAVDAGEYVSDEYGNEWRTAHLTAEIDAPVLDKLDPLWDYAEELDTVYCSTCHAKIAAHHYTTNAWGPIAKGMGDRTDISNENLEILTKYLQTYAKDMVGH